MIEEVSRTSKPVPNADDVSGPFFEGARRQVLMIQQCTSCSTAQVPGRYVCDECLSDELEWIEASGRGTVFTFVIVHQKYHPAFLDEIPYNVALIELEEGPRLTSNIVGIPNEAIYVGMPVQVTFEDGSGSVPLPKFRAVFNER
jgi:uncharacterized protein